MTETCRVEMEMLKVVSLCVKVALQCSIHIVEWNCLLHDDEVWRNASAALVILE